MSIRIFRWEFRGREIFTCFTTPYVKRFERSTRSYKWQPIGTNSMEDLAAWEVGQLLGGN